MDEGTQSTAETSDRHSVAPKAASAISIASTIARQSLGLKFMARFNESKHRREEKEWDDDEETYFAKNQMRWYLEKVLVSPENKTHSLPPLVPPSPNATNSIFTN